MYFTVPFSDELLKPVDDESLVDAYVKLKFDRWWLLIFCK